jgi:hypothetical protein
MRWTIAGFVAACSLLSSCGTQQVTNAPPAIVEDCQREVAILTDREIVPVQDDPLRGPEATPDPIEDARAAKEVAGGAGLATWPEEALLYRCLRSRGVQLTPEQAEMLAEWEGELDADPDGSRD